MYSHQNGSINKLMDHPPNQRQSITVHSVRVFTCSACGAKGSCSLPPLESELLER